MTRGEEIAELKRSIEEQRHNIATIPGRALAMRQEEEAKLASGQARGEDGILGHTRGDWPSDGLLRMVPALRDTLRETEAKLAALLRQPKPEELDERYPPPWAVTDAIRQREVIATMDAELAKERPATTFDADVRSQFRSSRTFAQNHLDALIARFPSLAEEDPIADDQAAAVQHPTHEEIMAEPTVHGIAGAPSSPFPPTVERDAALLKRRT